MCRRHALERRRLITSRKDCQYSVASSQLSCYPVTQLLLLFHPCFSFFISQPSPPIFNYPAIFCNICVDIVCVLFFFLKCGHLTNTNVLHKITSTSRGSLPQFFHDNMFNAAPQTFIKILIIVINILCGT